jgi:succinate dehydrogenase / fumarate reductase membrane anchor subunit
MTIPLKTIATPTSHYGSRLAGTMSFIVQRITGVLNIAFAVFFLWLVVRLARADVSEMGDLVSNPVVAVVTGLLIVSVTLHMRAGMREVIEDYVHEEKLNRLSLQLNTAFTVLVALVTLVALIKLIVWG